MPTRRRTPCASRSDLVCPWCYLGKHRFDRALVAFEHRDDVEVMHHSFQLNPAFPRGESRPTHEFLAERYGMTREQSDATALEMEQRAAADGLEYHMAGIRIGNTVNGHRLVHLAADRGLADKVIDRFSRAHFTEQRSLFTHDSLVELATEARAVLASDTYESDVEADSRRATELGASGVPFFVLDNRYGVAGPVHRDVRHRPRAGVE